VLKSTPPKNMFSTLAVTASVASTHDPQPNAAPSVAPGVAPSGGGSVAADLAKLRRAHTDSVDSWGDGDDDTALPPPAPAVAASATPPPPASVDAAAAATTALLYQCDGHHYGCGYSGLYDDVAAHEQHCAYLRTGACAGPAPAPSASAASAAAAATEAAAKKAAVTVTEPSVADPPTTSANLVAAAVTQPSQDVAPAVFLRPKEHKQRVRAHSPLSPSKHVQIERRAAGRPLFVVVVHCER
jgi:hypothetical protein